MLMLLLWVQTGLLPCQAATCRDIAGITLCAV